MSVVESAVAESCNQADGDGAPLLRNFVGGKWVDSKGTAAQDVYNPATGAVIARVPLGTREDVDAAVAAARAAYPSWRATPVVERARKMFTFQAKLEANFDEIARIVTTEEAGRRATEIFHRLQK